MPDAPAPPRFTQLDWTWRTRWDQTISPMRRRLIDRVQRRFRHHVRSPTNPRGRIHREGCQFCEAEAAEFHHLDYGRPFYGTWCCASCHRKIEHGSIVVGKRDTFDYSSLVLLRRWKPDDDFAVDDVNDSEPVPESVDLGAGDFDPEKL